MLVFPFAMVLLMFVFDVGRVYLTLSAAGHAANVAVSDAAGYGAAGAEAPTSSGAAVCSQSLSQPQARDTHRALDVFCRTLDGLPGGRSSIDAIASVAIDGGQGDPENLCSDENPYVSMTVELLVPTITPGIGALLGTDQNRDAWAVSRTASAACDVIPSGAP